MKNHLFKILCGILCAVILGTGSAFAYSVEGEMAYNEGLDYFNSGEYGKALESFKIAVDKDPDFIDAYYNMGALYEYLKSYQSAIASYSKINQLDPQDTESMYKLAELYYKVNNTERALFATSSDMISIKSLMVSHKAVCSLG